MTRWILPALLLCSQLLLEPGKPARADESDLPVLGDTLSGVISLEQEHELGQAFLRSLRRRAPTVQDPLLRDYTEHLTFRLAAASKLQDRRLSIIIIDSPQLNAFAAPGGIIGLNLGLFRYGRTIDEFASIVAHELAHLSQRHFARRVDTGRAAFATKLVGLLASVVLIASGADSDASLAALGVTQALAEQAALKYSRQREAEADRIGIGTLAEAGMNPQGSANMLERLNRLNRLAGREIPEFLLTHPITEVRIANSHNQATNYDPTDGGIDLDYQLMRMRARVLLSDSPRRISQEMQDLTKTDDTLIREAATYGQALASLRADQADLARLLLGPLIEKRPAKIAYILALAEAAFAEEDYATGLQLLQDQLTLYPGNYPTAMTYAQGLTKAGRPGEARPVLESLLEDRPEDEDVWYLLAEVLGLVGDIPALHQARSEYFVLHGAFKQAIRHLHFALPLVESSFLTTERIRQRIEDIEQLHETSLEQTRGR